MSTKNTLLAQHKSYDATLATLAIWPPATSGIIVSDTAKDHLALNIQTSPIGRYRPDVASVPRNWGQGADTYFPPPSRAICVWATVRNRSAADVDGGRCTDTPVLADHHSAALPLSPASTSPLQYRARRAVDLGDLTASEMQSFARAAVCHHREAQQRLPPDGYGEPLRQAIVPSRSSRAGHPRRGAQRVTGGVLQSHLDRTKWMLLDQYADLPKGQRLPRPMKIARRPRVVGPSGSRTKDRAQDCRGGRLRSCANMTQ